MVRAPPWILPLWWRLRRAANVVSIAESACPRSLATVGEHLAGAFDVGGGADRQDLAERAGRFHPRLVDAVGGRVLDLAARSVGDGGARLLAGGGGVGFGVPDRRDARGHLGDRVRAGLRGERERVSDGAEVGGVGQGWAEFGEDAGGAGGGGDDRDPDGCAPGEELSGAVVAEVVALDESGRGRERGGERAGGCGEVGLVGGELAGGAVGGVVVQLGGESEAAVAEEARLGRPRLRVADVEAG